ncbi:hypothetical protein NHX12_029574 [Muraenolepis orangiensis]|uniref:phosphatidate phosphatase n=1 Tax=Muraenolepis orangiensis TaxID=630683 RepID=A0A9Q0IKZ2_9TELE|nr:hypothetical protein NHX12_029574 [Muraenolepis orangiensis]
MADGGSRERGPVGQVDPHLHPSLWSQTMNLVGQLAETVLVTVKELYRGLNPATLTGGIDVIVVRQPDGSHQCSPFHVRFGKLGVLRSKEKVVDIEVNGEPVNLHMKLGDNGEAFFVEENEDMESIVPAHLCTSPISMDLPPFLEEGGGEENGEGGPGVGGGGGGGLPARRKKRRRKRVRSGSHLREEDTSSSDEREREREHTGQDSPAKEQHVSSLQVSKSIYYSICEEPGPAQNRESSPMSDSELVVKPQESSGPQMQWNWGAFPKVCPSERSPVESQRISASDRSRFRTIARQRSFDDSSSFQTTVRCSRAGGVTVVRPLPRTVSMDLDLYSSKESTPTTTMEIRPLKAHSTPNSLPYTLAELATLSLDSIHPEATGTDGREADEMTAEGGPFDSEPENNRRSPVDWTDQSENDGTTALVKPESTLMDSVGSVSLNGAERRACAAVTDTLAGDQTTGASTGGSVSVTAHHGTDVSEQHSVESEPCEMGATSALPLSACNGDCVEANEEGGSTPTDGEAEGLLLLTNQTQDSSQDGTKAEQQDKKKGKRSSKHLGPTGIYLDDLTKLDPEVAALYFPKSDTPPGADQGSNSGNQSPQSVGSGSLGSGAMDSGAEYLSDSTMDPMDVSMSLCGRVGDTSRISQEKFKEHIVTYDDFLTNPGIVEDPNLVICINSNYYNWAAAAPMILSKQAFQKNLPKDKMPKKSGRWWFSWGRKEMVNQPKTSAQEQGEVSLSASTTIKASLDDLDSDEEAEPGPQAAMERLQLREGANQVVFSVTTQYQGTCRCEAAIYLWNWDDRVVISDIDGTITKSDALGHILPQNGYKFLYCSARAIGMAAITKDYLQWVNDKGTVLPKGPVLLAPSSLFSALHREVIEKKPEVFKIACLTDIKDLFNPRRRPFYAAFGNRTNDAYAYQQVGVPDTKIFTINPKGELIQEKTKGNKSSHFSYWREPLPPLDLEALS